MAIRCTVLICTRDRPEPLRHCLESVLAQDVEDFELIVIDNASRSFSVPQLHYSRPTRFFSCRVPGISFARNSALSFLNGPIVALLDDDAIAENGWLEHGLKHFADPTVGCVTGKILPSETNDMWNPPPWQPIWAQQKTFDRCNYDPITTSAGMGSNLFIRTEILRKHRFPEMFGAGTPVNAADEDYLFFKTIQDGFGLIYEPHAVVQHPFSRKILRNSLSRSAYLSYFLLYESGYRIPALKRILKRIPAESIGHGSFRNSLFVRLLGLAMGPPALLLSLIRRSLHHQDEPATLIASFES